MRHVLFNPISSNNKGEEIAKKFISHVHLDKDQSQLAFRDITKTDCMYLMNSLEEGDEVFIVGGGGTILRFANEIKGIELKNDIFFAPAGVGNDFFTDIAKPGEEYTRVNEYIIRVHSAIINGKEYPFLTDVGMGIDGYVCRLGNTSRDPDKNFNYSFAVVKGICGKYKPCGCSVIVDGGEEEYFDNVWMASTLGGKTYGGGVKIAPTYDRLEADYLELIIFTSPSAAKTLLAFPSIKNGTHADKNVGTHIFRGKKITVKFTSPRDAQVDGDTIPDVLEYTATF